MSQDDFKILTYHINECKDEGYFSFRKSKAHQWNLIDVPSLKFHLMRCSGTMSMILGISRPILSIFCETAIRNDFSCLCLSPFSNMEGTWSPRRF